jgi:potassium-transporting ATPase KdpC subunit
MRNFLIAVRMTVVLTVFTGLLYPMVMAALAHILFPWQASGSLIVRSGRVVGSELIGQKFSSPRYFQGRPSAAGDHGYDASNSGASNLGPTNRHLIDAVRMRLRRTLEMNPGAAPSSVPIDLVTASASGLDPEISPAAAELQVARVASSRGLRPEEVEALVSAHTRGRFLGIFGEPGVNVLMLNLALDDYAARMRSER